MGSCMLFKAFEIIEYYLQSKMQLKVSSIIRFITTILVIVFKVLVVILKWGTVGLVCSYLFDAIVAAILYYIHTPKGKYNFDYFKYTMPIFGTLFYSLDFSRLMRAMLLNLENGMRIQDAMEVSKNVVNNYVMRAMVETSINNILVGNSWIEPFERSGLSSSMITEMLKVGMQTDLSEMMEKLLEYMEVDIKNIMDKIMAILPQVVYSIVGVILIFVVIVVLVPCIEVYMGNFLFSAAGL